MLTLFDFRPRNYRSTWMRHVRGVVRRGEFVARECDAFAMIFSKPSGEIWGEIFIKKNDPFICGQIWGRPKKCYKYIIRKNTPRFVRY
jgi:hypothetical protein